MAYEEQTKDIKGDIRVNIPTSLSSVSDSGVGSGSEADLGAPSHGQLPQKQMKMQTTAIFQQINFIKQPATVTAQINDTIRMISCNKFDPCNTKYIPEKVHQIIFCLHFASIIHHPRTKTDLEIYTNTFPVDVYISPQLNCKT